MTLEMARIEMALVDLSVFSPVIITVDIKELT
ncbi:MAG: hypothetical protein JWR68_801 [Polaromonas sp.]|jgi:hypothetical protein|nr:hypothetical protein [Polaromonas sp.]